MSIFYYTCEYCGNTFMRQNNRGRKPRFCKPECRANNHRREHGALESNRDGLLIVYCWCGEKMMRAEPEVIQACKTVSCGRPNCYEGTNKLGRKVAS